MPEVRGFRGTRFNPHAITSFDDVVTPPFDVISPEEREMLYGRSPYNWARIILPEGRDGLDKYETAAADLASWIERGVLGRDGEPMLYLLEQRFTGLDGNVHERRAFFAAVKLPEEGERTILGHERTFHHKVEDRLALTAATGANTGAVFALYRDPEGALSFLFDELDEREPDVDAVTIDGVEQRLWAVPESAEATAFFADKTVYIADGHHRFRTATAYRDAMRAQHGTGPSTGYDYVFMGFVALEDPGLYVYPAHRVLNPPRHFDIDVFLSALEPWFEVTEERGDVLARINRDASCAIGLALASGVNYVLRLKDIDRRDLLGDEHGPAWRDLDVSVLHGGILERVLGLPRDAELVYEKDPARALALVADGEKGMAFLLRNMHPEQICACADANEYMPQKATYFFPKLPSGAVFRQFAE